MKKIIAVVVALSGLSACRHNDRALVDAVQIDSLMRYAAAPAVAAENLREMSFWRSRINPVSAGFLNETKYAGGLALSFHLGGDIDSLKKADSILLQMDLHFNHHEASAELTMVSHCITEHRFSEADRFLREAGRIGLRPYEALVAAFDVDFELGRYPAAKADLNAIRSSGDYNYLFRKSKMDHLDGRLDSSIADMVKAAGLVRDNDYLEAVALANAGDLYLHAGDLSGARDAYIRCIRLNGADYHSWLGLGWIALAHDGNVPLAEKIFRYAGSKTTLPDPLFRLTQAAAVRHDTIAQLQTARSFARMASAPVYGRMYNKYLIQLYTGILADPAYAESLAKDELNNRATPQTYAWYAWALLADHKTEQAYDIYRRYVSGQPLEALELYWMGRLMHSLNKNYNARAFYEAAAETRYDLDPADADFVLAKSEE